MTQQEIILNEIRRNGNRITTFELMRLGISQYQARLKGLRERLVKRGWILTEGEPIEGQKRNFMYRLIIPKQGELALAGAA